MHRHRSRVPSPWIVRFAGLIGAGGRVLDLACGAGRHTRHLRDRGLRVTAIDIDTSGLADLADDPLVEIVETDLERPGGVFLYETFALGNERLGRPRNPDYLLERGELLALAAGRLTVLAYENVTLAEPRPKVVQRVCARK